MQTLGDIAAVAADAVDQSDVRDGLLTLSLPPEQLAAAELAPVLAAA